MMLLHLVLLGALVEGSISHSPETDKDRLQGVWKCQRVVNDGKAIDDPDNPTKEGTLTFCGDKVTAKDRKETGKGTFRIKETSDPKRIDFVQKTPKGETEVWEGIYRLSGDRLTICLLPSGKGRPADFTTKPGDGRVLFELKRDNNDK